MNKYVLFGIVLALLLLNGCTSNPDVQFVEITRDTVVYDETIRINNCGGKGDSEQTVSREFATEIELGGEVSAGYLSIVQGNLSAKYSEYRNISKSQRLVAPPGTNMEFVLRWSDEVRAGNVQINGKVGGYEVRIPVSVEQISSQDLGCGEAFSTQTPTPTNLSSTTQSPTAVAAITPFTDWTVAHPADIHKRVEFRRCSSHPQDGFPTFDNRAGYIPLLREDAGLIEKHLVWCFQVRFSTPSDEWREYVKVVDPNFANKEVGGIAVWFLNWPSGIRVVVNDSQELFPPFNGVAFREPITVRIFLPDGSNELPQVATGPYAVGDIGVFVLQP